LQLLSKSSFNFKFKTGENHAIIISMALQKFSSTYNVLFPEEPIVYAFEVSNYPFVCLGTKFFPPSCRQSWYCCAYFFYD